MTWHCLCMVSDLRHEDGNLRACVPASSHPCSSGKRSRQGIFKKRHSLLWTKSMSGTSVCWAPQLSVEGGCKLGVGMLQHSWTPSSSTETGTIRGNQGSLFLSPPYPLIPNWLLSKPSQTAGAMHTGQGCKGCWDSKCLHPSSAAGKERKRRVDNRMVVRVATNCNFYRKPKAVPRSFFLN